MINPNWDRWIRASIDDYFDTNKGPYIFYHEGEPRKTSEHETFFEVRFDGLWIRQISATTYKIELEINVLVSCNQSNKLYEINTLAGFVSSLFAVSISIFKLGDESGDDGTLVDCITLDTSSSNKGVMGHKYGLVEPSLPVIQATEEAKYYAFWTA